MVMVFQNSDVLTIGYEVYVNSKYVCRIDSSKDTSCKVDVDIAEENIQVRLIPVYNKNNKTSNVFRNIVDVFFEWITLCFYLIITTGTRKSKVTDFCEYITLYGEKILELAIKNNSKVVFVFKSSQIKDNYKLKKVFPIIKEYSNIKIFSNEEKIVFNSKYLRKKIIKYFNICNIVFLPILFVFGFAIINSLIKLNVALLILVSILFILFLLIIYIWFWGLLKIIGCVKNMQYVTQGINAGDGSLS